MIILTKRTIAGVLMPFLVATNLFATANAPIQRIDVANILGSAGSSQTDVEVSFFSNYVTTPCLTTTIPFSYITTVWVGTGQVCNTPVTSLTITPLTEVDGIGPVYSAPSNPILFSGTYYSTQITISQSTAPVFDPNNGALTSPGTIQTTAVSHWK